MSVLQFTRLDNDMGLLIHVDAITSYRGAMSADEGPSAIILKDGTEIVVKEPMSFIKNEVCKAKGWPL